jgi:DNA repair protein RecO (recombination protein O)
MGLGEDRQVVGRIAMSAEKATGLVLRTTDFSETSKIATLWTREFGKVRVLAKGGRRLKSNFESALDLLTLGSMVFLRKSSGGLDLLTEARVLERFPRLRTDLAALYAAYYVAELLGDWTEDYDPHPNLFDEALDTLRTLGVPEIPTPLRLLKFETVLLRELGYAPRLEHCAGCRKPIPHADELVFSSEAGGVVCGSCRVSRRGLVTLSQAGWRALQSLEDTGNAGLWRQMGPTEQKELRRLFNQYVSYLLGRRPRTMPYLGS